MGLLKKTVFLWGLLPLAPVALAAAPRNLPAPAQAIISSVCTNCHQGVNAPAGLDVQKLDFNLDDRNSFGWWVRAYDAVQSRRMPPGAAVMSDARRSAFLKAISEPMIAHEQKRAAEEGKTAAVDFSSLAEDEAEPEPEPEPERHPGSGLRLAASDQ